MLKKLYHSNIHRFSISHRKWWKARNMRGRVAHVPHTIVTQHFYPDESVAEGNNESMYGGAHSSGYSKSRESRERVSLKRDQESRCDANRSSFF